MNDSFRLPTEDEWHFMDKRPYCADCGKLKGLKKAHRYYPEKPCLACGSTRTKLRDVHGNEIDYEKWLRIQGDQNEKWLKIQAEAELANSY